MDHLSEFQRQLCSCISTVGPRLTMTCLGAMDERQLIEWISVDQLSITLRARVGILDEIIHQGTEPRRAEEFLGTYDEVMKSTPAIYLLTMPADEAEQTRQTLLDEMKSFCGQTGVLSTAA